jgi:histone chaperone ASF1
LTTFPLFLLLLLDLEWKVLYVASAQDASRDQVLDEILVGPVPVGVNKFVLQADAPDPSQLAQEDLLGVTVVLVTCSYKEREFVRVGYYVNNEYHDPNAPTPTAPTADPKTTTTSTDIMVDDDDDDDDAPEDPKPVQLPNPIPLERIQRQILADKPRVTKFPISWGEEDTMAQQQAAQQQAAQQQLQQQMMEPSDLVNMQEESNASFGNSNNPAAAAAAMGGGLQAMAE